MGFRAMTHLLAALPDYPENFTLLRHPALSALRQENSVKLDIKSKHLRAVWDNGYALKLFSA
jgi:hypothetical protein